MSEQGRHAEVVCRRPAVERNMAPANRVKEWLGGRFQPSTGARLSAKRRARKAQQAQASVRIRIDIVAPLDLRKHISLALKQAPGMRVVAGTADHRAAFNFAARTKPDVVVIDADCDGPLSGVSVGRRIQKNMPAIGIVLIADDLDMDEAELVARDFGTTWSYVHRSRAADAAVIIHAVNSVDRSIQWVDPSLQDSLEKIWKIAAEQRDVEEGLHSGQDRMASAVQTFQVKGYEGSKPRSFGMRSRQRFDL